MLPYYEDDDVTIYHADCREILPELSGITSTIFSPPYNVAIEYEDHNDVMTWDAYRELADAVAAGIAAAMPHGRTWCNVTPIVPGIPNRRRLLRF